MASRVGTRPEGSDGTDFEHRERVAGHYQTSVANKPRLRYLIYLHLLLVVLMFIRLLPFLLPLLNFETPSLLLGLGLPPAWLWEYAWLTSVLPSIFGLLALGRNRVFLLQQYLIGTIVFGLLPVFFGAASMAGDLLDYWRMGETKNLFLGFPVVLLWNMFLVIALQTHGIGLLVAWSLSKAWQTTKRRKKAS